VLTHYHIRRRYFADMIWLTSHPSRRSSGLNPPGKVGTSTVRFAERVNRGSVWHWLTLYPTFSSTNSI
jgi:hypothetical protein